MSKASSVMRDDGLPGGWDVAGALSIVMQGGLFAGNIIETANHASHWRQLFPQAEIILAISVTDLLRRSLTRPGRFGLAPAYRDQGLYRAALRQLHTACDKVRVSPGAVPLPPLKWDGHGANNVNLQIAAARCGLKAATGRHVLRVRSDLIFADRRFIAQHAEGLRFERGPARALGERVLVSWLYTLNPYTLERLPLHISDWFHFGLTDDVRRLWNVPFMSMADATHHKIHRYPAYANILERMIVPRLAVEQHLAYHAFRHDLPALSLDDGVDWRSREFAVDVLVDNFVLCDVAAAGCIFDKYAFEFANPARLAHCITRSDWLRMAASTTGRPRVLMDKAQVAEGVGDRPFPRRWDAASLLTKQGLRSGGDIVARPFGGVLVHGPYDDMPSGRYLATLETAVCEGPGSVALRATTDRGATLLAERRIRLPVGEASPLVLPFDLVAGRGRNVEIVCELDRDPELLVTGLLIAERPERGFVEVARYDAASSPMLHRVGKVGPGGVSTDQREGHLLFGPSAALDAGTYRARFVLDDVMTAGGAKVEVAVEVPERPDQRVVAIEEVAATGKDPNDCVFNLAERTGRVEFRLWVTARTELTVREVVLERM